MSNQKKDTPEKPLTINQRRWRKFKGLKRGYYSFYILIGAFLLSFFLPLFIGSKALMVSYQGEMYFPALRATWNHATWGVLQISEYVSKEELGQEGGGDENVNYRELQAQYELEDEGNWVLMPLYPYDPFEDLGTEGNKVFMAPFETESYTVAGVELSSTPRIFGTDNNGRDVFSRMAYGFNISIMFALVVALSSYLIGIPFGALSGYFGGWTDMLLQRIVEIWSTLPFLFLVIIFVALIGPSFFLLVALLAFFGWIGISLLMRAEFYREKSKDYVAAAVSIGVPTRQILIKHILPNSLVPIITYFPFAVVLNISSLVSLDFLGFGLAPPTPSWGAMVGVGLQNITTGYWWLVIVPLAAMFVTLLLTVFIGEAVREAFDPKVFSRLR